MVMKKASKKTPKMYPGDHVLAMFEEIKDQFMAFGEGQQLISDEVKGLTVKVEEINERLIRVEDDVVEIKHRLSEKVDRDEFNKLEKRMVKLEKLVLAKMN